MAAGMPSGHLCQMSSFDFVNTRAARAVAEITERYFRGRVRTRPGQYSWNYCGAAWVGMTGTGSFRGVTYGMLGMRVTSPRTASEIRIPA